MKNDGKYKVVDAPKGGVGGDPIDVVDRMNKFLSGQQTLFVQTEELVAVPAGQGKFKTSKISREIALARPDKMRVRRRDGKDPAKQFWYDGANATLQTSGQKFYGQVPFSGKLPALLEMLQKDYAVTVPLSDLLRPGLADSLRFHLKESRNVGIEKIDGRDCHHIQIKTAEVEGDLWIDVLDSAPYPRRVVLRYPATPGKPSYEAKLSKWQVGIELAKTVFEYKPTEGLRQIQMLPVR